jgi:hypothetical protein
MWFRSWYQLHIRGGATDFFAELVKPLGNYKIAIGIFGAAVVLGLSRLVSAWGYWIQRWGQAGLVALLVGFVHVLAWQKILGASRPTEADSRWHFLQDNNAVSGHSFVGALPFLVAAAMVKNRALQALLYLLSFACFFSRINNDDHYLSQTVLGWWLAFLAVL